MRTDAPADKHGAASARTMVTIAGEQVMDAPYEGTMHVEFM
jgi:hypothetical protein